MNARTHRVLCLLEFVLIAAFLFVLMVPIQDYAMQEFKQYIDHPSPQSLQAFRDKKEVEVRLREKTAVVIVFIAVVLAVPTFQSRRSRANRQS